MINFDKYEVLTFDCYGTLIDWESGILAVLNPLLANHDITLENKQILELFAEFETEEQEQKEYIKYREVLKGVVQKFGKRFDFEPSTTELVTLADSIKNWLPFPDTVEALKLLKDRFKLAIISNIDDAIFASTAKKLEVKFDWVITAEQAESYKPSLNNFQLAFERIGLPVEKILHVACSVYHDIVPANSLKLSTVWINRRANKEGAGAAPPASGRADLEVPDLKTLASLCHLLPSW